MRLLTSRDLDCWDIRGRWPSGVAFLCTWIIREWNIWMGPWMRHGLDFCLAGCEITKSSFAGAWDLRIRLAKITGICFLIRRLREDFWLRSRRNLWTARWHVSRSTESAAG